jgi:hypothetical protein
VTDCNETASPLTGEDKLLRDVALQDFYSRLTNPQLALYALAAPEGSSVLVQEMCCRLYPEWFGRVS